MLTLFFDDLWSQLQQPAKPSEVDSRFRLLLSALDTGWAVEEPVYLRPRWGGNGPCVYHFILYRDGDAPRLVTVPAGGAVEEYVRAEGLRVVAQSAWG